MLKALTSPASRSPETGSLTHREVEVLRLVAQGHSKREITHRPTFSEGMRPGPMAPRRLTISGPKTIHFSEGIEAT